MKIIITADEALDKGIWPEVADIAGCNPYAISEGMDVSMEIELTVKQAEELGLVKVLK